jgi:hypothetical protein
MGEGQARDFPDNRPDNLPLNQSVAHWGGGMDNTIPYALLAFIAGSVLSAASAMMMGEGVVQISLISLTISLITSLIWPIKQTIPHVLLAFIAGSALFAVSSAVLVALLAL